MIIAGAQRFLIPGYGGRMTKNDPTRRGPEEKKGEGTPRFRGSKWESSEKRARGGGKPYAFFREHEEPPPLQGNDGDGAHKVQFQ